MHLSVSEIKKLLKKWHFYKAHTSTSAQDELARKVNAVEKAVAALDDLDKKIIQMHYIQGAEIEIVMAHVFMARSSVYYRLNVAVKEMSYFIANTV